MLYRFLANAHMYGDLATERCQKVIYVADSTYTVKWRKTSTLYRFLDNAHMYKTPDLSQP